MHIIHTYIYIYRERERDIHMCVDVDNPYMNDGGNDVGSAGDQGCNPYS